MKLKVGDKLKLKKDDSSWKILSLDSNICLITFEYTGELIDIGEDANKLSNYAFTRKSSGGKVVKTELDISLERNERFVEKYFYTQSSLRKLKLDRIRRKKRFDILNKVFKRN